MSFEDSGDNLVPTTVIDEETEFKTNIEFTEIMDGDCLTRILKKFTKLAENRENGCKNLKQC